MPKYVVFAPKPANFVRVNVRSTTVTTANAVLNLVIAALRVVAKWYQQRSLKKLQVSCKEHQECSLQPAIYLFGKYLYGNNLNQITISGLDEAMT
jgi:hypothetical protein